jgi:hypothetical protein
VESLAGKRRLFVIEPRIARPTAPPKLRIKVFEEVATPICGQGTVFCIARVNSGLLEPHPKLTIMIPAMTFK